MKFVRVFLPLLIIGLTNINVVFSQNNTSSLSGDSTKITTTPTPPEEIYKTFGQFRERIEDNFGYINPIPATADVDNFLSPKYYNSLRVRFGFEYYLRNKFTFRVNFQDVEYYAQVPTIYYDNLPMLKPVYEAWGQYYFTNDLSVQAGRIPLSYDNGRILSNRDWLPQALSHNALVLKYDGAFSFNLGAAYNFYNPLDQIGSLMQRNYKMFEYLWIWGSLGSMELSFLAINMSMPEVEYVYSPVFDYIKPLKFNLVSYRTVGFYSNIGQGPIFVNAEFYYQFGRYPSDWLLTDSLTATGQTLNQFNTEQGTSFSGGPGLGKQISAYMYSVSAYAKLNAWKIYGGYDYLSGDNFLQVGVDDNDKVNAFDPLFGDFHKFYGAMDYFYAGSWTYGSDNLTCGLQDAYGKISFDNKKLFVQIAGHYFMPAGKVWYYSEEISDYQQITKLGYELDLDMHFYLVHDVAYISAGASILKPTQGLIALKNFDPLKASSYYYSIWLGFNLKPTLYKAFKYKNKLVQGITPH